MINAAIVGMGWWGKTVVESVQGSSDIIRFVAGASRTSSPELESFAASQNLNLVPNYEALLADPRVDAVVLATPHSMHPQQVIAAAAAGKHVFCEKPFALTKKDAEAAVSATQKARIGLSLVISLPTMRMRRGPKSRSPSEMPKAPMTITQSGIVAAPAVPSAETTP